MGSNTSRKTKVLVSNELSANGGNTITTITNDDVVLLDRSFTELADTATISSNANADVLYVALGTGSVAAGYSPIIETIQTKNIRKVTSQLYSAPVQRQVILESDNFDLAANTDYSVQIVFHDNHSTTASGAPLKQFFVYTSGASVPTKAEIVDALVVKINASKLSYVTASNVAGTGVDGDLKIIAKAITANSINSYQFVNFEVIMRSGFKATATKANTLTYSGGAQGQGVGQIVKDLELENTNNLNRIEWPIAEDTRRALNAGTYNLITIEYGNVNQGDLLGNYTAPRTLVIAFAAASTDGGTTAWSTGTVYPSAKQSAFVEKLTSIVESVGVYVSDVVPA